MITLWKNLSSHEEVNKDLGKVGDMDSDHYIPNESD